MPDLRIVSSDAVLLHEESDSDRVERLRHRLTAEGLLRNPPVAAPLEAGAYVILDGANRVTALRALGAPDQLVQVIDYDDPAVRLDVWAHALPDDDPIAGEEGSVAAPWRPMPADAVRAALDEGWVACGLLTPSGAYGLPAEGALAARVKTLSGIVARYKERGPIYRVEATGLDALGPEFGRNAALVLFPKLTKQEIRAIARLPVKLPSGISRHVVPLRALRVNLDLSMLLAAEPTAGKQARLDETIRTRLLEHRVRHYPEPTVFYDD
ncbi:MAG: ParB N-terminal domain-containing protein [bacterium]